MVLLVLIVVNTRATDFSASEYTFDTALNFFELGCFKSFFIDCEFFTKSKIKFDI